MSRVIFRADAGSDIGGGHVVRCLTLAERLGDFGWKSAFAVAEGSSRVVPRLGVLHDLLEDSAERLTPEDLSRRWPSGCDVLVVDHYGLDARFEAVCRGWARKIMVIDDLADRPHACDLLLDATLGRLADEYFALAPGAKVLAGVRYTLLRPAFRRLRAQETIERRRGGQDVRRVLVSLGLTDIGGHSPVVVRQLLILPGEFLIDVVLGEAAPSASEVAALAAESARVTLHVDPADFPSLMAQADLAVGAGGTTSWERCCLGLPTVLIVLADNQRLIAERLEAAGAVVCSSMADVGVAVANLLFNRRRRQQISQAAAALVDGEGATRVANAILAM